MSYNLAPGRIPGGNFRGNAHLGARFSCRLQILFTLRTWQNSRVKALCFWKNLCSWKNKKQKEVCWKKRKKEYHSVKASPTLAFRFQTKTSPSYRNKSYIKLKPTFPFICASISHDTKTWTIAWNREFESCLWIRCLSSQHIFRFFHFCFSIFLCLWLFAHFRVVLLNAPLSDRAKSNVAAMGYFSREILIQRHWR